GPQPELHREAGGSPAGRRSGTLRRDPEGGGGKGAAVDGADRQHAGHGNDPGSAAAARAAGGGGTEGDTGRGADRRAHRAEGGPAPADVESCGGPSRRERSEENRDTSDGLGGAGEIAAQ